MKNRHRQHNEYSSTPRKKAPWLLIISIILVLAALAWCLISMNNMVTELQERRMEWEESARDEDKSNAPRREAPPATEVPAAEAPAETLAPPAEAADEITLWTYPIGEWGNAATVAALVAQFEAETGIHVNVEYLTYLDGDDRISAALNANAGPDLILESPFRLVSTWGSRFMVDISDMFDSEDRVEMNPAALNACFHSSGEAYMYPLAVNVFTMAINKTLFEELGIMDCIDEETRTWTTQDFQRAMDVIAKYNGDQVGAIYCVGQGGDQGTRALVTNFHGGRFTDEAHTRYTWDDPAMIQALADLRAMNRALVFDNTLSGSDEIALFYNEDLSVAFCWNVTQQRNPNIANTGAGRTRSGDEIMFMAFPSPQGTDTQLYGSAYGFGIVDNGDPARVQAAKLFIRYMCDSWHTQDAVKATGFFPARDAAEGTDLTSIWASDPIMAEYGKMTAYLGDLYDVTPGWSGARTHWWNLLQAVGKSSGSVEEITELATLFAGRANGR